MAFDAGVSPQGVRVAVLAAAGAAVIEVKAVRTVELGRDPAAGVMARSAVQTEQPGVVGRVCMAGAANRGRVFEIDAVRTGEVAAGAGQAGMGAGERENGQGVVEG